MPPSYRSWDWGSRISQGADPSYLRSPPGPLELQEFDQDQYTKAMDRANERLKERLDRARPTCAGEIPPEQLLRMQIEQWEAEQEAWAEYRIDSYLAWQSAVMGVMGSLGGALEAAGGNFTVPEPPSRGSVATVPYQLRISPGRLGSNTTRDHISRI